MSVTIIKAFERKNKKGESFNVLVVEGGLTMVQSKKSNNWFAQSMRTNILASMSLDTCKSLIGTTLPGKIIKQKCTPYEYKTPNSKIIKLDYTYSYVHEQPQIPMEEGNTSVTVKMPPNEVLN